MDMKAAAHTSNLVDLYGVAWTLRLQLMTAEEQVRQAKANHASARRLHCEVVKDLKYFLAADKRKAEKAEEVFLNPLSTAVERENAATEHAEYRENITRQEKDIALFDGDVSASKTRVDEAQCRYDAVEEEYKKFLLEFVTEATRQSGVPDVWIFHDFLNERQAGFVMNGETIEASKVHVYCRYPGDGHDKQGHLVIEHDGMVSYCRRPRGQRGIRSNYLNLGCVMRVRVGESQLAPLFILRLFFDKSATLVLP